MSIHIVIVFFLFHSFTLPLLKYAKRTFRVCDVDEGEFNLLLKYIQDVYGEQYNVILSCLNMGGHYTNVLLGDVQP